MLEYINIFLYALFICIAVEEMVDLPATVVILVEEAVAMEILENGDVQIQT